MKIPLLLAALFVVLNISGCSISQKKVPAAPPCYFVQSATISGTSMTPLLSHQQSVDIAWDYYNCHEPQNGEIVVVYFSTKDHPFMKTLVAIPGDRVTFQDHSMYVNQKPVQNSLGNTYTFTKKEIEWLSKGLNEENILQEGKFLVLGDNLSNNFSSRKFGPIFREQIVGKVLFEQISPVGVL